ncbi:MAG: squalene/phytoene synthase family protein [Polyangiaceae bacterium]|nr:squalene/phytoene synthase family protein [Polyangiaceae bacterium]
MTISSIAHEEMTDWEFCCQSLEEVSRTFTQPIQFLPPEQKKALTIGYLLCRVVDTVEDCVGIDAMERDRLFSLFQSVLRSEAAPEELIVAFENIEIKPTEARLMQGLSRVMNVFTSQSSSTCAATIRWVSEMADGMRLYSRRNEGREFTAVMSLADLERYCFYVAGTVGHLITDLYSDALGDAQVEIDLREYTEGFGLGLQMVNIVKDITDDFERGVCYIPRQICRAQGFEPEEILEPQHREAALNAVAVVIDRAGDHLDAALEYTLAIPAEHHQLRLFCLLPLWMAVETLELARENVDVLIPDHPVKITREIVGKVIADCGRHCRDDQALRDAYLELKRVAAARREAQKN